MVRRRGVYLLIILSIFLCQPTGKAAELQEYGSDEQEISFRLIDAPATQTSTSVKKLSQFWNKQLPATHDTTLFVTSFLGTILVGSVLFVLSKRQEKSDEN